MDWIHQAKDMDSWRDLVNTFVKLQDPGNLRIREMSGHASLTI